MAGPGNTPKNHHFVPQLLQRQWADENGQVQAWKWQNGCIVPFRTTPQNIMSETHLYRAEHIDQPGLYEAAFSGLESAAAAVLAKFRDPAKLTLTQDNYEVWASFLLAQRVRVPAMVASAKQKVIARFTSIFDEHDPDFELFKREDRFSTPLRYIEEYHPNVLANFHLDTLLKMAADPKHVQKVCRMKWFVGRGYSRKIILGDDPIMLDGDLRGDACLIGLPISPTEIFFAASNDALRERIARGSTDDIAVRMNEVQARQAQRFVIGDVMPRFLERRLRKPPSGAT